MARGVRHPKMGVGKTPLPGRWRQGPKYGPRPSFLSPRPRTIRAVLGPGGGHNMPDTLAPCPGFATPIPLSISSLAPPACASFDNPLHPLPSIPLPCRKDSASMHKHRNPSSFPFSSVSPSLPLPNYPGFTAGATCRRRIAATTYRRRPYPSVPPPLSSSIYHSTSSPLPLPVYQCTHLLTPLL